MKTLNRSQITCDMEEKRKLNEKNGKYKRGLKTIEYMGPPKTNVILSHSCFTIYKIIFKTLLTIFLSD